MISKAQSSNIVPQSELATWPLGMCRHRMLCSDRTMPADLKRACRDIERSLVKANVRKHKDDHAATVVSLSCESDSYVIKRYNFRRWHKALRRAFGPSKARLAWYGAAQMHKANLPVVQPLAFMEDRVWFYCFRSYLITRYSKGVNGRDYLLSPDLEDDQCKQALKQIVISLRQMHEKGIAHGDTKDTNILFSDAQVSWIDCDSASYAGRSRFGRRKRIKDWQILQYNWRHAPRVNRIFLQVLREQFSCLEFIELVQSFVRYTQRKLCLKSGMISNCLGAEASQAISRAAYLVSGDTVEGWQRVRSSQNAIVARSRDTETPLYSKVFLPRDRWERFKAFFAGSRCERAVRNKRLLMTAGFNVSEVVHWRSRSGLGVMVTKAIPGEPLDRYFNQSGLYRAPPPRAERIQVLHLLGHEVGFLHAFGFVHGDLRLSNILLEFEAGRPRLHFLDNERTMFCKRVSGRQMVKNLTQINVDACRRLSNSDRLRIFRSYQEIRGRFGPYEERKVVRKIIQRTDRRAAMAKKG